MKILHKQLLMLIALTAISRQLVGAYEYDLKSMIGDPIVVKINQNRVDKKDYYQILFPGKTVKQTFPAGNAYCLATNGLQWAPYDSTAPFNGGLDFVDKTNGRIPENKQREFGDKIAHNYVFLPMEIIMQPNEVYNEISKAATQLLQGIDSLACQTIDTAKAFSSGGSGGGFSGGGLGGGSDKSPKADETTQVIELLKTLEKTITDFDAISTTALEKAEMTNNIKNLLTSENIKLLQKLAKLDGIDIARIKDAARNKDAKATAIIVINRASGNLLGTETKIDVNSSDINTLMNTNSSSSSMGSGSSGMSSSYSSSYGSGMSSGSARPMSSGPCNFGLGKIGKASGKLASTTLCTSREFIIYFKTDADGIPIMDKYGRPVLTATTVAGQ